MHVFDKIIILDNNITRNNFIKNTTGEPGCIRYAERIFCSLYRDSFRFILLLLRPRISFDISRFHVLDKIVLLVIILFYSMEDAVEAKATKNS